MITVFVDGCVSLKEIARCADADYNLIKQLNPALKADCTPPDAERFPVQIPKGTGHQFEEKIAKAPRLEKTEWVRHRVRRGETLSTIAAKYGVSMRSIMEIPANKLKNPHKIRAGHYLLVPVKAGRRSPKREPQVGQPQPLQVTSTNGKVRTIYRVRSGDSLSKIAENHSVSVSDLKTWNHLWGHRFIYPDQKLIVWTEPAVSPDDEGVLVLSNPTIFSESRPRVHVVQPGDTLWDIAQLYGLSVKDLKNWNGISSVRRLQPGVKLKLEP
jgi:membrane-bound lytic murein transglycosylase D